MSRRTERVDELLRREIAAMLVMGQLRDPRLAASAQISVTAVQVSGDLSQARVFIDVLDRGAAIPPILAGLRSSAGLIRSKLGQVLRAKRVPKLLFEYDDSVERGERIESILAELREEEEASKTEAQSGDDDAGCETAEENKSWGEAESEGEASAAAKRAKDIPGTQE